MASTSKSVSALAKLIGNFEVPWPAVVSLGLLPFIVAIVKQICNYRIRKSELHLEEMNSYRDFKIREKELVMKSRLKTGKGNMSEGVEDAN